ncbi:MAG TPA: hypothetical protein VGD01_01970 [Candidatus Elarobacter sp.]|jgi:hypothetical protein
MAWSNAQTRALLKGLRHPHILRNEPAIAALRRRYRVEDDGQALLAAVDAALANDPALKEIIYRCDLNDEDTLSVARALHFSERQFHRYRSFAVEAVAAEIDRATTSAASVASDEQLLAAISAVDPERANALLRGVDIATPAQRFVALRVKVEMGAVPTEGDLQRFDPAQRAHAEVLRGIGLENAGEYADADRLATELDLRLREPRTPEARQAAFELTILRRLQARRRGRIADFAAAVDDMPLYGSSDADAIRAAIGRAHVAVHHPAVTDWRERMSAAKRAVGGSPDVRLLRYVAMVEGYLAFVRGDPELALRNSVVATLAGANPGTALQAEALHARAALVLGRPWTRPAWTREVLPGSWFQPELDVLGAFHALRAGDGAPARRLADAARAHPAAPNAPCIGIYVAAVDGALGGGRVEPAGLEPPGDLLVDADLRALR